MTKNSCSQNYRRVLYVHFEIDHLVALQYRVTHKGQISNKLRNLLVSRLIPITLTLLSCTLKMCYVKWYKFIRLTQLTPFSTSLWNITYLNDQVRSTVVDQVSEEGR